MGDRALPTGTVTFLFTDIEGSTRLARALGSERWRDVLDLHGLALRRACEAAGGTLVRTEGDSFLFAFTQPTAALSGAVASQRALAAASWPHGVDVRVRMGAHTGEVTLGTAGSGVDYVGFEVHRAARVASAGHGGQVLVSETTRALAEHGLPPDLTLRDLGEHTLRDLARPERLWQLVAPGLEERFPAPRAAEPGAVSPAGPAGAPRASRATRAMLGRDDECRELLDALDESAAGRTTLVLLVGEAGIGKTTLATAVERAARERGFRVAWGRCWETGDAPPLWPWLQALRALGATRALEALDPDQATPGSPAAAAAAEAAAAGAASPASSGAVQAASAARFRALDTTCAALDEHTRAGAPVLMLLDDLHAGDVSSLRLLHFVARTLRAAPLCIVGTMREVEARLDESRAGLLQEISREARVLPLSRLDAAAVAALVRDRAGEALGDALATRLFEVTEGNPLFLDEAVRLVLARGGDPRLAADPATLVRGGVATAIRARLSRLSSAAVAVVEAAAVLGRESGDGVLADLRAVDPLALPAALGEAAQADVLVPREGGGQVFTHVLLREAALGAVAAPRRVELHRAAALALGRRVPAPGSVTVREAESAARDGATAGTVAHHWIEAGDLAQAIEWTRRAAEDAERRLAFEEAARVWGRMLEALEQRRGEGRARCEARLRLGQSVILSDEFSRGQGICRRAAEEAAALGAADLQADAALAYATQFRIVRSDPDLVRLLREALVALPGSEVARRARVTARLSSALLPGGDPREAAALAREGIALARSTGDAAVLLDALHDSYGSGYRYELPLDERRGDGKQIVRLALSLGRPHIAMTSCSRAFRDAVEAADVGAARAALDQYETLARDTASPFGSAVMLLARACLCNLTAQFEDARAFAEKAETAVRAGTSDADMANALSVWRMGAAFSRFEPDQVERLLDAHPGDPFLQANLASVFRKWAVAAAGRRDDALALLAEPRPYGGPVNLAGDLVEADAAMLARDGRHLALRYERLRPGAGTLVTAGPVVVLGPADRVLALVAEMQGDRALADRHAAVARQLCERAGAIPLAARVALDDGERLLARGDSTAAAPRLAEAGRLASAASMPWLAARALAASSREPPRQ